MAHVYAHCDFFRNNIWFQHTNRKMIDVMANHATRVRRYIDRYGYDEVEAFIDVCLSLEDLIDPHSVFMRRQPAAKRREINKPETKDDVVRYPAKQYMDRFINPPDQLQKQRSKMEQDRDKGAGSDPPGRCAMSCCFCCDARR